MYEAAKEYGIMVRDTAKIIADHDDIYKAAAAMPYDVRAYFVMSRTAFFILYSNIQYEYKIVAQVIQDFILSKEVDQYILSNPDLDKSKKYDFIVKDCEDFFSIMETIKDDITALSIIARPRETEESQVKWAVKQVTDRLESTPENKAAWGFSIDTLFPIEKTDDNHKTQKRTHSENDIEIQEEKEYHIVAEKPLFEIYNYLKQTKEISGDTDFLIFKKVVESADATLIKPKTKWKYNAALSLARECIKEESIAWTRDVCSSLKIASNKLTKNIDKESLWYKELELTFKNSHK